MSVIHICNVSKYTFLIQSYHNVLVAIETSCTWSRSGSELIHGTGDGCRHYLAIPAKLDFCSSVFPLPSSVETACAFQPPLLQIQQLMSMMRRPPQTTVWFLYRVLALGDFLHTGAKIKTKNSGTGTAGIFTKNTGTGSGYKKLYWHTPTIYPCSVHF